MFDHYNPDRWIWCVVQFKQEGTLFVVPNNWILSNGKECYWPPFKTDQKVLKASEKRVNPCCITWDLLEIEENIDHAVFGEKSLGTIILELLMPNHEIELREDVEPPQKKFRNDELDGDCSFSSTEPDDSVPNKGDEQAKKVASPAGVPDGHSDNHSNDSAASTSWDEENPGPSNHKQKSKTSIQSNLLPVSKRTPLGGNSSSNNDIIMRSLEEILLNQAQIKNDLMNLQNNNASIQDLIDTDEMFTNILKLKTMEEFLQFELNLAEDKHFLSKAKKYLNGFGGKDGHFTTRNILAALMTDDLAMKFNFKGKVRKQIKKMGIEQTRIYKKIVEPVVLHKTNQNYTRTEIKKSTETWLKEAKKRYFCSLQEKGQNEKN
ncbi:hypothetical protein TKK_0002107 [Trichogramma kaykai]|uniref:DUF4806 domain-containing protein n=1 Tax=Trichogramma kaykai TaxID=54128 RepID=A0ABD2WN93_9HYME